MNKPASQPWYLRIGPGLITACVVIGPGSVLTSSQVGAAEGYSRNWIVVVAVLFMMVYTSLGAKLGAATNVSPGTLVAQRAGRPLAVLIGVSVFFISALFQFGNNLGAHAAFSAYFPFDYWVVAFNTISLAFLFGFRNLYKALERLMMVFVAVMLLCFAANLVLAGPNVVALLSGFVPRWSSDIDISLLGLVGTTFVISAAFLQTYLVQQKGWGKADVKHGLVDARVGATIMLLITLMIVSTSAAVFHEPAIAEANSGESKGVAPFANVSEVATQLKPLLGNWGRFVFCLGLFSAAYSSFLVNSMIGGFILSDGLGWGSRPDERGPRLCTAAVLIVGMLVALGVIVMGINAVPAIILAQALTVVAAPLLAGVMIWLTNLRDVMGEDRNRTVTNTAAALGLMLLLAMACRTAFIVIPEKYERWKNPPPPEQTALEHRSANLLVVDLPPVNRSRESVQNGFARRREASYAESRTLISREHK